MSPATRPLRLERAKAPPVQTDKAAAILNAALSLFVERGFHGTSIPEVAARAAVGAGTIYRYFESKEALGNALYRKCKEGLLALVLTDFPFHASTRDQFAALWQRMGTWAKGAPLAFAFLELHSHDSYLDEESRALERRIVQFGVGFIESAQARGDLRTAPAPILIGIVLGAFLGLQSRTRQCGYQATAADWTLAEQCVWEAIRI
ncbi:MAG: TetR/AcrR family transcriptional regulator [Myxococcales bacterium]|nr:TetR/AcrR family transcriptional regulator [Myxococcales bacterium]